MRVNEEYGGAARRLRWEIVAYNAKPENWSEIAPFFAQEEEADAGEEENGEEKGKNDEKKEETGKKKKGKKE